MHSFCLFLPATPTPCSTVRSQNILHFIDLPSIPYGGLHWSQVEEGNPLCLPRGSWQMGGTKFDRADWGRAENWARILWVHSRCCLRFLSIRFSDIALETCSLTLPAALFLISCKGMVKAKKQRSKAIQWLVQDAVTESQLCISSGSHQDTSQFPSIYNPSPELSFTASVIHSHWIMNTQAIRGILPNYSSSLLIDLCSLLMGELEKESSFCISCDKAGWHWPGFALNPKRVQASGLACKPEYTLILYYTIRVSRYVIRLPWWQLLSLN